MSFFIQAPKSLRIIFSILFLCLLFSAGWLTGTWYDNYVVHTLTQDTPVRENSPDFKYINPLLFVDNSREDFPEYSSLEEEIENYTKKAIAVGDAKKISVYFRDLNSSHWGGVNKDELYAPSSMLKVAVLLSYLKLSEKNPDTLSKNILYQRKDTYGEYYTPKYLTNGNHSTLELLQNMIIESDNSAMSALVALHQDEIIKLYQDLQLPDLLESADDFMSVEDYSYIFRALYNSTYLKRNFSEQALKLLTYTKFDKGIVAGVSASTTIAHKFGEHTLTDTTGKIIERQLHDCGIIYYPQKPYLLCVMTKGEDFKNLETVIAKISEMVFTFTKNINIRDTL
ncbi:MAG: serine hydrolase [Candidatus Taylorbacteria bacterium]|nr:serine hydrolase [Candidatus Taylorbacteria bacterium]